jgi:hypothetical protein
MFPQLPDERRLGFDDLANELKLHILSFALVHPEPITVHNHREVEDAYDTNLEGLIRTSHAVRARACEVYYSSNTFIIQRSYGDDPQTRLRGRGFQIPLSTRHVWTFCPVTRAFDLCIDISNHYERATRILVI